jgi:hypothetical protein
MQLSAFSYQLSAFSRLIQIEAVVKLEELDFGTQKLKADG